MLVLRSILITAVACVITGVTDYAQAVPFNIPNLVRCGMPVIGLETRDGLTDYADELLIVTKKNSHADRGLCTPPSGWVARVRPEQLGALSAELERYRTEFDQTFTGAWVDVSNSPVGCYIVQPGVDKVVRIDDCETPRPTLAGFNWVY